MKINKSKLHGAVTLALGVFVIFSLVASISPFGASGKGDIAAMSNSIKKDLIASDKYKCCLKGPCTYCLMDHGKCDCLEDIMKGKAPCGECIGEILEGEGNPLLAEYFANALAEELGEENKAMLKNIIAKKYGIPEEKQL